MNSVIADLDRVIADYALNALLVTPDASYQGPPTTGFLQKPYASFSNGKSSFVLYSLTERGTLVYTVWHG